MDPARQNSQDELKDPQRFWREERQEGAIYATYLKRVTYHTLSQLEREEHGFSQLMWETQKIRVIKAGTLERLIESLTMITGELDSTYVNVFLATYRSFATSKDVLIMIIKRYKYLNCLSEEERTEISEAQLKTVKSVISVWLDTYPEDFRQPPDYPCLHLLQEFAENVIPAADTDLAMRAKNRRERFIREETMPTRVTCTDFRFSLCEDNGAAEPSNPLSFHDISNQTFAQQLTSKDAGLFRKLVAHQCLGSVWARRDRKVSKRQAPTVMATISQFNKVSLRVVSTILSNPDLKASHRAKIIMKWISIAEELRDLKNFSSLKAIISGMQTHPVYRLKRVWALVQKESMSVFEELADIFSEDNNQITSRELLMKEATAKFPDLDSGTKSLRKKKNLLKRQSWIENGIVHGTVPYLGTFLTDLTMIDAALPDTVEDGLINFEKKRKEFEVLAQIRLLQSAAQMYNLPLDRAFWVLFDSIKILEESESYELSCVIESPSENTVRIKKKSASFGNRPKQDIMPRIFGASSQEDKLSIQSLFESPLFSIWPRGHQMSQSSSASSLVSNDSDPAISPFRSLDSYVIKVSMQLDENPSIHHVYKSIILHNTDHTHIVKKKVLDKYNMEGKLTDDYCLSQILSNGEFLIPEKANVFYALTSSNDLNFVMRTKIQQDTYNQQKRRGGRRMKKLTL